MAVGDARLGSRHVTLPVGARIWLAVLVLLLFIASEPRTPADAESLIEYCHVVSSRTRLTRSGRIDAALTVERVGEESRGELGRVAQR